MGEMQEAVAFEAGMLGALIYRDPASREGAGAFSWLASGDAASAWESGGDAAREALRAAAGFASEAGEAGLHQAFTRLFVGPYKMPAPPWGSVYLDPESVIFGNETLELRQWMREAGVKLNLPEREPEDHFGLVCLMLSFALQGSADAERTRELVGYHLLPWAPRFLELLGAGARELAAEAQAGAGAAEADAADGAGETGTGASGSGSGAEAAEADAAGFRCYAQLAKLAACALPAWAEALGAEAQKRRLFR